MKTKLFTIICINLLIMYQSCIASEIDKAMDILINAEVFTSKRIGYKNTPSESAWAISTIIASPGGIEKIHSLCESRNPESFFYGIMGLFEIDRPAYEKLKMTANIDGVVVVKIGDIIMPIPIVDQLRSLERTGTDPYVFKAGTIPSIMDTVCARRPK